MRKIATTTLVGLAVAFSASAASAQACNGTAPFSAGKMRVGVDLEFPSNATGYAGDFSVGTASALYGTASVGIVSPSGGGGNSTTFGVRGGKVIPVGAKKTVEACPQLFFNHFSGPNSPGFDVSGNSFGAGVTFGTTMKQTSWDLVPFGGAQLHRDAVSVTGTPGASDTNLDLLGGVGFVLSKTWTVRPMITVPLTNNGDATFGVYGSLNFGGKP